MGRFLRRTADLVRGLMALALIAGLIAGVPALLVAIVGWPLPTTRPSLDLAQRHIIDGDIPDTFIMKTLAVIVWTAWAQTVYALTVETVALIRGRIPPRAMVLPGIQHTAAKLAASVALLVSALQPSRAVAAASLVPPTYSFQPTDHNDPLLPGPHAGQLLVTGDGDLVDPAAPADEPYVTVVGDSWWAIAELLLDDGFRWAEIRDLNLDRRMPDGTTITTLTEIIQPGWPLLVPAEATLPPTAGPADPDSAGPASEPGEERTVTAQPGDHLWKLAHLNLTETWGRQPTGDELAGYWADVVAANQRHISSGDADLIYPEEQIILPPPPAPTAHLASSPDEATAAPGPPPAEPATSGAPGQNGSTAPADDDSPPRAPGADQPAGPSTSSTSPAPGAEVGPPAPSPAADSGPAAPPDGIGAGDSQAGGVVAAAGIVGTAIGGGALLVLLRRRRHYRAARRRPGIPLEPRRPDLVAFEDEVRPIADTATIRRLAAINQLLSHRLEQNPDHPLPSLLAAQTSGADIDLILQEPCPPLDGFATTQSGGELAWRADPGLSVEGIEAEAGHAHPFSSVLLPVGATADGDLLIDFETLAAVSVTGDPGTITGWLRSLATGVRSMPWSEHCNVVAVGIDDAVAELPEVIIPADPVSWADLTARTMDVIADDLPRPPRELRTRPGALGDIYHLTLALIGPDHPDIARQLGPVAAAPCSPLILVAAAPLDTGTTIHIEPDLGTVQPAGITFTPVTTPAGTVQVVAGLITSTTPEPDQPAPATAAPEAGHVSAADGHVNGGVGEPDGRSAPTVTAPSSGQPTGSPEPDRPGPAGADRPSVEADEAIAAVLAPLPVEVVILASQPAIAGARALPPKLEAVTVYLAFRGSALSTRIQQEFWPSSVNRATFDNAMAKIRNALGPIPGTDQPRLSHDRRTRHYRLSDDVGTDWSRAQRLLGHAGAATKAADEIAYLRAALDLVQGRPGEDAPPGNYAWLRDDYEVYSQIETPLIDAASRLGVLALDAGDPDLAHWAAGRGLALVPGQEALYRIQMRAAHQSGDLQGVETAYRNAVRAVEAFSGWDDPQLETQQLYAELSGRRRT
jgi:hypothetical protein